MNPTYDFKGQVALVTGAASGMGRAQPAIVPIHQHNGGSGLGEGLGGRAAHARRRAGDEGDLTLEVICGIHDVLLLIQTPGVDDRTMHATRIPGPRCMGRCKLLIMSRDCDGRMRSKPQGLNLADQIDQQPESGRQLPVVRIVNVKARPG
jgi:hypothetical protein